MVKADCPRHYYSDAEMSANPLKYGSLREPQTADVRGVLGWLASEKLDGIYVMYRKGSLFTSSGRKLRHVPDSIMSTLPPPTSPIVLEGELFESRTSRRGLACALAGRWDCKESSSVRPVFFDIPSVRGGYKARYNELKKVSKVYGFQVIPQTKVRSVKHFHSLTRQITTRGGEGLVLRHPDGLRFGKGRSKTTLKWKPTRYARGKVVAVRHTRTGVTYSVKSQQFPRNTVRLFSRHRPFRGVGDSVRFRYNGLHTNGMPEFARILIG